MLAHMRKKIWGENHSGHKGGLEILRWVGPGLLVTVGFIDPGNWATNMAAGSTYGYGLLWVVTASTLMLIMLQHNAAHLGIVTGECLAESCAHHLPRPLAHKHERGVWVALAERRVRARLTQAAPVALLDRLLECLPVIVHELRYFRPPPRPG